MQVQIVALLWPYILKALVGTAIAGAGALLMYPFRKAKKEWDELKSKIESAHTELVQQRTNCLTTLQDQGAQQIELLSKSVEILDGVRLDLAEQTGYIKASLTRK